MYYQNLKYSGMFIVLAFFAFTLLTSCEEEENGESNKDETEVWEPYEFDTNTSFEYDYEYLDASQDDTSSGTLLVEIGDPEVEISGTIDGQEFSMTESTSSDVDDNFTSAISKTPIAPVLHQPYWTGAFSEQELEVGAYWDFSYGDASITFEVTGTDEYAGYEGYVIEANFEDAETATYMETCVKPELPIALMINIEEEGGNKYIVELTSFED